MATPQSAPLSAPLRTMDDADAHAPGTGERSGTTPGTGERPGAGEPARDETPEERADRNLVELLQELRVLQTGVQIIFAFLLGVAFTNRFPLLNHTQQYVYIAALLLSVLAAAVFATPVAIHRGLFHCGEKALVVAWSTRLAKLGLLLLALALDCVVFLVIDFVLGRAPAIVLTAIVAATFVGLWFVLPWALRRHVRERTDRQVGQ